jgi:hypothetical protein
MQLLQHGVTASLNYLREDTLKDLCARTEDTAVAVNIMLHRSRQGAIQQALQPVLLPKPLVGTASSIAD